MRGARAVRAAGWLVWILATGCAAVRAAEVGGRVTDAQTGEGIPRARVAVALRDPSSGIWDYANGRDLELSYLVVLTGPDGGFAVRNLPAGKVWLAAERVGYLGSTERPMVDESHASVQVQEGETPTTIVLRLTRPAVIKGRITDNEGRGVAASVTLLRQLPDGKSQAVPRGVASGQTGEFRATGLEGGRYYLMVEGSRAPNDGMVFTPQFYPGEAVRQSATAIDVQAGQEVGVEFQLKAVPAFQIRGALDCAGSGSVSAWVRDGGFTFHGTWDANTKNFTISSVPSGSYDVAGGSLIGRKTTRASVSVTVDGGDVGGVVLTPTGAR